jgi:hypothetical protein
MNLQGVQPLELKEKFFIRAKELETPWEEFDLMKQYRQVVHYVVTQYLICFT